MKITTKDKIKIIIFVILLVVVIIYFPNISQYYDKIEPLLKQSGVNGPLLYMLLMIAAIVISPIPSAPLAIISGAVFGPLLGMVYTLVGATIGAVIAFLISRFLFRDFFQRRFENQKHDVPPHPKGCGL